MQNAAIIIIGNEILSGRTLDKNSNFICTRCSLLGIKVSVVKIIPDSKDIIVKTSLKYSKKYIHVFITGGIGPTHDDITSESLAIAFKRKYKVNKKAKDILIDHYKKSDLELNEARLKMAKIPSGSRLIYNPVSAAPGYKIKNIWVMAGVPKIMQAMFLSHIEPKLKKEKNFSTEEIIVYKPEGDIAHLANELQKKYTKLDIGSYPFYNPPDIGTNIIIRGKNKLILNEAKEFFCKLLKKNLILFS